MAFCKNCGNQVPDGVTFCNNCGAPIQAEQPQYQQPQYAPQPQYQQPQYAPYAPQPVGPQSTWDGGVFDTFVNALVASLIISFTCGIATPWAVCYMMKFIVEHAVIDGKRMRFDGNGGQLFGNWIKWMLLTVITCGIYSFWVAPRMYKWVASHIHTAN